MRWAGPEAVFGFLLWNVAFCNKRDVGRAHGIGITREPKSSFCAERNTQIMLINLAAGGLVAAMGVVQLITLWRERTGA